MKFKKINEDTVRCIISEEDLKDNGLKLEDFLTDQDKTRDFINNIVIQAQEEVGYESKNEVLAVQLMPLPNNGIAITFSKNSEASIKDMLEHIKEAIAYANDMGVEEVNQEILKRATKSNSEGKTKAQTKVRIYRFDSLLDVEQFACALSTDKVITSKLYKDDIDAKYYLVINKGRLSAEVYNKLCERVIEFATLASENPIYLDYCEEHYKCLIKKKAIHVLRSINQPMIKEQ